GAFPGRGQPADAWDSCARGHTLLVFDRYRASTVGLAASVRRSRMGDHRRAREWRDRDHFPPHQSSSAPSHARFRGGKAFMSVTGGKSYFEDFAAGMEIRHRRGRTLMQEENARWSLQTLNTAQSHWNNESMKTYLDGRFETPIVNAAIVIALAAGLTSNDMT